jgi:hypothetical protein
MLIATLQSTKVNSLASFVMLAADNLVGFLFCGQYSSSKTTFHESLYSVVITMVTKHFMLHGILYW